MRKTIKRIYKFYAVPFYSLFAKISRIFASRMHYKLFKAEWCIDNPEQFDHNLDLFWQWKAKRIPHWLERGVYNLLAIKCFEEPVLYELCCGDGFNAACFYSTSCKKIWACDFDEKTIREARKQYKYDNIDFQIADIRKDIPEKIGEEYPTNIIWDAAIEHFTPSEIHSIMKKLQDILSHRKGILSGMTIVERTDGKGLEQHEYEFKDMNDLKRFFEPYFENVIVWETIYPDRHNLYFMASDGTLPFSEGYKHWVVK